MDLQLLSYRSVTHLIEWAPQKGLKLFKRKFGKATERGLKLFETRFEIHTRAPPTPLSWGFLLCEATVWPWSAGK